MKKLINKTLASLLLAVFLLTSCEKEGVKNELATVETKDDMAVSCICTNDNGEEVPGKGTGKVKIEHVDPNKNKCVFTPVFPCCKGDKAKFDFTTPEGMPGVQNALSGEVTVHINGKGTWFFTITCECPDGVTHKVTIVIVTNE